MSMIWPQLYQHRPGRRITTQLSAAEEKVKEESRFLCHRYFSRRMRRSGLALGSANLANIKSFNYRTDEHATLMICQMIEMMEQLYPETFSNVSTHMHVSSFNERLLCQDFSRFVETLFMNGIKWPLILAYYAFCGGLAEECVRHGNARLIASVLNWSDCYVSMHIATWIREQGGWVGLIDFFRRKGQINETEAGPNRLARLIEKAVNSFAEATKIFKRSQLLGENMKHLQKIAISSTVMLALLYVIVMVFKVLFGEPAV